VTHVLVSISINLQTKSEVPTFTYSKDVTGATKFKNGTHDHDYMEYFVIQRLKLDIDNSSLSHSRGMIGAPKFKIGHVTLPHHGHLGVVCHPKANT